MPAIDICEPPVIRALEKAGWVVTHQPYSIRVQKFRGNFVFADLRLKRRQDEETIIVVEVKCFTQEQILDEFYGAIGQYVVYRVALALRGLNVPIYLAVPEPIYTTFFTTPLIRATIQDIRAKIIIVNLDREEVIRWID